MGVVLDVAQPMHVQKDPRTEYERITHRVQCRLWPSGLARLPYHDNLTPPWWSIQVQVRLRAISI
jgi:hypothetical protein